MYIANCPFNKMKILSEATIGLEKSFSMMYSNIGLNSRETVPLIKMEVIERKKFENLVRQSYIILATLHTCNLFPKEGIWYSS